MRERIHQLGFDPSTLTPISQDVTPANFAGLEFPTAKEPLKLGRFVREVKESVHIRSPHDAAQYLLQNIYTPFEEFDQEEMWLLLLNTKNRITHEVMLYRGTVNSAFIRTTEIFKEAIRVNAAALLLSHCHPSGDPTPSPEDVSITRRVNEVARLLDLEVLDHIVVGENCWTSLKEKGLGFE